MDAPSIRPALKDMASRLATAGYYVMLPYLFYRGGPFREFGTSDEDMHARQELMGTVTPTNIVTDAAALLAVAADDPAARDGKVGAVGFCMSGGLAIVAGPGDARSRRRGGVDPRRLAGARHATTRRTSGSTPCRPSSTSPGATTTRRRRRATCRSSRTRCKAAGVDVHDRLPHRGRARLRAGRRRATTARRRSCTGSASTRCCARNL